MKDERKDLFRFVDSSDELNNNDSLLKPIEDIGELDVKNPFVFGEGLKEPEDCADEDWNDKKLSVVERLSFELADCQELINRSTLFHNNVFFSGIILDIEEISETVDGGEEPVEKLVALKFKIYHSNANALCITGIETDVLVYPNFMESVDILAEFEVGDLVGFSGYLKDDFELLELCDSDDAVDDYMSPANIYWTSAFMMHKNFLDTVGIDIPEDDETPEDPE